MTEMENFEEAIQQQALARRSYLEKACGNDPWLKQRIDALLSVGKETFGEVPRELPQDESPPLTDPDIEPSRRTHFRKSW
jgi:hypothetical protein